MTTPAIHINKNLVNTGYQQVWRRSDGYLYPPNFVPDVGLRTEKEDRPESITSLPDSSGFRYPTNWSHSGSSANNQPHCAIALGYNYQDKWTIYGDGYGWGTEVSSLPGFPSQLESQAVNKALLKLKNQKVDLSVAFGERKETAELLTSVAHRLADGFGSLRRKGSAAFARALSDQQAFRGAAKAVDNARKARDVGKSYNIDRRTRQQIGRYGKEFINDFLQLQYGAKPLMQDSFGALDALNKRERDGKSYVITVKATAKQKSTKSWNKLFGPYSPNVFYPVQDEIDHFCLVRLDYYLENPFLASLSQLGITNPLATAYELTRFSFVLDWFLPVGDYLSAWDAAMPYSFKAGSITKSSRVVGRSAVPVCNGAGGLGMRVINLQPFACQSYNFSRSVLTSSPLPRIPRFKDPISGVHVANAIALLASRFQL